MSEERKVFDTKFYTVNKKGFQTPHNVRMLVTPSRIEFLKSPFGLKDEIKAMRGAKWHGFEEDNPRKVWSVDNRARNWFQIKFLMGQNPYDWFDQKIKEHEFERPLRDHQRLMANASLTYRFQILAAEMGTGKTLSAIEIMEKSGYDSFFWIGPKKSFENIQREFAKWDFDDSNLKLTNYEAMRAWHRDYREDDPLPRVLICDESSRLKTEKAKQTEAVQFLADAMRARYGNECYVILMSGTPSPKLPSDWWSQAEIAYPGFLMEGSSQAMQKRLCFYEVEERAGQIFNDRKGWRDDEKKCNECGFYKNEGHHKYDPDRPDQKWHKWQPSKNEVAYVYERLKGLVTVLHKKDVLDLPDKIYEIDYTAPTSSTKRAARMLVDAADSTIIGLTWLRELSDGFLYKEEKGKEEKCRACKGKKKIDGWMDPTDEDKVFDQIEFFDEDYVSTLVETKMTCPKCKGKGKCASSVRTAKMVPCPKDEMLRNRLAECEETGRIVIFAGFQGALDRIKSICHKEHWNVVRCDGRGWEVTEHADKETDLKLDKPLEYWANRNNERVAFVSHPKSGGLSLNLTESRMAVFWSNDYNPETRSQAEDRVHRLGMDENKGVKIVDFYHLPTDKKVHSILKENRKVEKMTLGDVIGDSFNE